MMFVYYFDFIEKQGDKLVLKCFINELKYFLKKFKNMVFPIDTFYEKINMRLIWLFFGHVFSRHNYYMVF